MRHPELVEIAVSWLRRGVPRADGWRRRYSMVFGEIVTASGETPDAIGFSYGLSCVVECKVSRADFFHDRKKPHAMYATTGMGRQRWYLTPVGLVSADEVPEWCGLAYAHGRSVEVVRIAPHRADLDARATMNENIVACSAARRFQLGVAFDARRGRFAPAMPERRVDAIRTKKGAGRS